MNSDKMKLQQGIDNGVITTEQADRLFCLWNQADSSEAALGESSATMSKFLYYLGALIVIGAMSWLMNTAWDLFKGMGLFAIATGYAMAFCLLARYFKQKSAMLSGLFVVMAVCMTPLCVFGLQAGLNFWPNETPGNYRSFYRYIRGGWFMMELCTIVAGLFSLRYSRIPFAMAPVAFALWFASMDITPIITGVDYNWDVRKQTSIIFGLMMLVVAWMVERRQSIDYAKWLYIFGAIAFWGGLSLLRADSEMSKFIYCLINVAMMFCGVLLDRKVLIAFGGIGFFGYLGYLSWSVFKNSVVFPFSLTILGLLVVYLGWVYHKKYAAIQGHIHHFMPKIILGLLPQTKKTGNDDEK